MVRDFRHSSSGDDVRSEINVMFARLPGFVAGTEPDLQGADLETLIEIRAHLRALVRAFEGSGAIETLAERPETADEHFEIVVRGSNFFLQRVRNG